MHNAEARDHEFPWIEVGTFTLTCTRCGEAGDISEWLEFLEQHSQCAADDHK